MQTLLIVLGLALTASWWPRHAHARFGAKLDLETFRDRAVAYRTQLRQRLDRPPTIGAVEYYPTGAVEAGQSRFSFRQMRKAMRKAIKGDRAKNKLPGAHYDKRLEAWIFTHDDHRSVFPLDKAASAVFYDGRLFLNDGHHKALTSTYLRAPRMPIKVVGDWSRLTEDEFLRRMTKGAHHYAHWRDHLGQPVAPVDLAVMENDPNLLLARLLTLRVDAHVNADGLLVCENARGATRPIAIKINNDITFFEFEIADALRRHGIVFDETRREQDISTSERRAMLDILRRERQIPGSRIAQILLLDEPKSSAKLDLPRLIKDHVTRVDCPHLFQPTGPSEE